jgi:uncharacterized protein with HEPN domain
MRSDSDRAGDILNAITRIERRTTTSFEQFSEDELLQIWAVHHLEIIGEAAKYLSSEFRAAHPDVAWSEIIRMRDRLVHGYWDVHARIVWSTIKADLPRLRDGLKDTMQP